MSMNTMQDSTTNAANNSAVAGTTSTCGNSPKTNTTEREKLLAALMKPCPLPDVPSEGPAWHFLKKMAGRQYAEPSEPLLHAIHRNNAAAVGKLLESGENVNITGVEKFSALHQAVMNCIVVTRGFRGLGDYGSQRKSLDNWRRQAAISGDMSNCPLVLVEDIQERSELAEKAFRIVAMLLEHGANRIAVDNHGRTPLYLACLYRCDDLVDMLLRSALDSGADAAKALSELVAAGGSEGRTPLVAAILEKNYSMAEKLLQAGANPNLTVDLLNTDSEFDFVHEWFRKHESEYRPYSYKINKVLGISLLGCAVLGGNAEIVDLLLRNGARSADGATVEVQFDATSGVMSFAMNVDMEYPHKIKLAPFFLATLQNNLDIVRLLVDAAGQQTILVASKDPGDLAVPDFGKIKMNMPLPPLPAAAGNNNMEMVRLFLNIGLDPNICDARGRTPLLRACLGGYTEVVQALLEAGANPNTKDREGKTPLQWALSQKNSDLVKILLDHGAEPNE